MRSGGSRPAVQSSAARPASAVESVHRMARPPATPDGTSAYPRRCGTRRRDSTPAFASSDWPRLSWRTPRRTTRSGPRIPRAAESGRRAGRRWTRSFHVRIAPRGPGRAPRLRRQLRGGLRRRRRLRIRDGALGAFARGPAPAGTTASASALASEPNLVHRVRMSGLLFIQDHGMSHRKWSSLDSGKTGRPNQRPRRESALLTERFWRGK